MGKILALRWSDVDLERRVAHVTRTHYTGPEGRDNGDVKTAAGRRNIALPVSCVQNLKAHRVNVRPEKEADLIWYWSLQQVRWRFE
jgi:integrase